jgi:hypothetical protein
MQQDLVVVGAVLVENDGVVPANRGPPERAGLRRMEWA